MSHAFAANLEILKERHPQAARAVMEAGAEAGTVVETFPSRAGALTARVQFSSGETHLLHSAYDPETEARRFAEAAQISPGDAVVVLGFALGHHVRAILDATGADGYVAVVESQAAVLRAALEDAKLADVLLRDNLTLFAGNDPAEFAEWLKGVATDLVMRNIRMCEYGPSVQITPPAYEEARFQIENIIESARAELVTLRDSGKLFFENTWRNLPAIGAGYGAKDLFGRFSGLPSINIAAGPSLDRSIAAVKGIGSRAVLIAVDTALRALLQNGIVPHIVVAVDPTELNARYFECVQGRAMNDVILVAGMSVAPLVLERFRGRTYFIEEATRMCRFLRPYVGERGRMTTGLSVAHTAFYLAREMGCDPIVLVAQDLSFSEGRTHASGVAQTWGGAIDETDPNLIRLAGNDGGTVLGKPIFRSFLATFEREIAATKARVINATEGGALIRRCDRAKLRDIVASLNTDVKSVFTALPERSCRADFGALREQCAILKAAAETLAGAARDAADLLASALTSIRPAAYIREANEHLMKVMEHRPTLALLEDIMLESRLAMRYKKGGIDEREQMDMAQAYALNAAESAELLARCTADFIKWEAGRRK
jgi:hypothetical protein